VSDNCSDDNTRDIISTFEDPRLRYFRQNENIGANNNFNFCLSQAKGKYFLLFHDDDVIDTDFIESCIAALSPGQTAGIIFTGVRVIDGEGKVLEEHENHAHGSSGVGFLCDWFKGTVALFLCSTLYNTQRLKEVGGFQSKHNLYDDLTATFKLVAADERVDVRDIKASFRRHENNRGSSIPIRLWVDESIYLLNLLRKLFPESQQLIFEVGGKYFSKTIYRKTLYSSNVFQQWLDNVMAYKRLGFCFSPFDFEYQRSVRPRLIRWKHRLTGWVCRAAKLR